MSEFDLVLNITLEVEDESRNADILIDLKEFDAFNDFISVLSRRLGYKITISKFDIQILYEDAWVNLIDLKSFYFFISNDLMFCNQTKLFIRNKENFGKHNVDFNLEGEKFQYDIKNDSIRPNMRIYHKDSNFKI
jgi:hypothetical protein